MDCFQILKTHTVKYNEVSMLPVDGRAEWRHSHEIKNKILKMVLLRKLKPLIIIHLSPSKHHTSGIVGSPKKN